MRPHILIICESDLGVEPRVLMEIEGLGSEYAITAAGTAYSGFAPTAHLDFLQLSSDSTADTGSSKNVRRLRRIVEASCDWLLGRAAPEALMDRKAFGRGARQNLRALQTVPADVIIAHHASGLPLAIRLGQKKSIPVIFNAHEYYPRQFDGIPWWEEHVKPVAEHVCRTYMQQADAVLTVSKGIADEYLRSFGVSATVVMSTKPYHELRPASVDPRCIRLVHHGIANPNRQLEKMVALMDLLDERFRLDFMLVPSRSHQDYYETLCRLIDSHPRTARIPTVPTEDIIRHINRYDIGLFHLVPTNFNLLHFLPNKFFEFVQARLAVAFTPIPEVRPLVEQYGFGVVSSDFTIESMAAALNALSASRIQSLKEAADAAARELSSEHSYESLREAVRSVIATGRLPASS